MEHGQGVLDRAAAAVLGHPAVKRVLDIVSRPNYAVAGAYEEMAAGHGYLGASQRIGRELFSGIASTQGDKQGFGAVFEDLGYGPGGSLSGIAPFAFSETGEGARFQKGGFFDWTARGSLGLAFDIALDPTTYLTVGTGSTAKHAVKAGEHFLSQAGVKSLRSAFKDGIARGLTQGEADNAARTFLAQQINRGAKHLADQGGVKLFGVTVIPGEVFAKPARSVGDGVTKFLKQSRAGQKVLEIGEGVGRTFNRDFAVRSHPDYIARKELYLSTVADAQRNLREFIEDLYRGTDTEERTQITNFIDSGGKTALDPKLAPHVKKTTDVYALWAGTEQEMDLLQNVRLDYVFHAYDASPRRVEDLLGPMRVETLRATLRGSQKARAFDTLDAARKFLASQGIHPIEDSAELLLRRGLRHIHATETHRFFTDVAKRFGTLPKELEIGAAKLSDELMAVERALNTPIKVTTEAAKLSSELPAIRILGLKPKKVDDPAGINAKVWYHGSRTTGLTAEKLDPFIGSHESLFGQGIYLTDNPQVARGYATARARRRGGLGVVYRTRVSLKNVLDLEKPAPPEFAQAIRERAKNYGINAAIKGETGEQLFTSLRKVVADFSVDEGIPTTDFVELFQILLEDFRRQGIDALTYTGGKRVGAKAGGPLHRVLVALDPNDFTRTGPTGRITAFKELKEVDPDIALHLAARGQTRLEEVRKLSEEGQRLFLARRFAKVQNPLEMENVLTKYREFEPLFPESTNRATRMLKSFNGESMATLPFPEFKGVTMPVDIAKDIVDFNKSFINKEDVRGLLWAYDKFMNSFKLGVTVIFPAFHVRNSYSNTIQQFTDVGLSALNPAMHTDAVRMLAGDVNGSFIARHGRTWGYGEVVYEAKRRGVIADYRNVFETFGDKIPIRTGKSRALDFVKHPFDTYKRFGGIVENEARLTLFANYLRRGLDAQTAAQRVNKVLFDYKNLSKIERDVLTRVFPFYRWTRKNVALQAERLVKNPGQAAIQAKLTRQQAARPEDLPGYLRGEFVFQMDSDADGKFTTIRGIDLPITDLNVVTEPLQLVMGNLSPGIKLLPELVADTDFFRKRRISEDSTPLLKGLGAALNFLPQRAKKIIDFSQRVNKEGQTEYRMNPTLTYVLIKAWAVSRAYGTAQRLMRAKSLASPENFLDVGTGIRLQDVDVDVAVENLELEYKRFLETKAVAAGIRKRFQRSFKPKGGS